LSEFLYNLIIVRPDWQTLGREAIGVDDLVESSERTVEQVVQAAIDDDRLKQPGEYRLLCVRRADSSLYYLSKPVQVEVKSALRIAGKDA
jgi:hypothetical protein